jgi:hypothetical protein
MKKMYQTPITVMLEVETAILCASGVAPKQATGYLPTIGKSNDVW